MKKAILAVAVLSLPSFAAAQTFDPNMIFSAGASYSLTAPAQGNRTQLSFGANMPGVKLTDNLFGGTLYTLSPGFQLHTVDFASGTTTGLDFALGGLTYHFNGGQWVVQAGVTRDITGDNRSTKVFLHVGGSLTSPKAIAAKRELKRQEKAKRDAALAAAGIKH